MGSPKPETMIESLRKKRKELQREKDRKIREYDADIRVLQRAEELLGQARTQTTLLEESSITTDEYAALSVSGAIVAFLDGNPTEEYSLSELTDEIRRRGVTTESSNFLTVVSSTANRLAVKDKKIIREKKKHGKKKVVWMYRTKRPHEG